MDNLQKLQAANPHIAIHTIHEAAFRRYGSVIQEDTSAFCAAAELALALTPWAIDAWEARKWNS